LEVQYCSGIVLFLLIFKAGLKQKMLAFSLLFMKIFVAGGTIPG
jgi:hypothetical protein